MNIILSLWSDISNRSKMDNITKTSLIVVSSLLVGAVVSDVLAKFLTPKKCNKGCLIIVHSLKFKDEEAVKAFQDLWAPLAAACYDNMSDVLSCELSVDTKTGLDVIVFERHVRAGHFRDDHNLLGALGVDKTSANVISYTKQEYTESDLGHMERW